MKPSIPDDWTGQDVRAWLLRTLKSQQSDPVLLFQDLDPSVQIQSIFDYASADAQEALKAGVVLALREWRMRAHGHRLLEDLCNIVALLKVTAAIPALDRIARNAIQQRPHAAMVDVLSAIAGTLGGLAPADDVERALRALFYDPRCPPQLCGQLFIGLCRCRPDRYWELVPRFRELRERSDEPLVDVTLAGGFAEAVPAEAIVDGLDQLTGQDRIEIVWLIEHIPDPWVNAVLTQRLHPQQQPQPQKLEQKTMTHQPRELASWFRKEAAPFSQAGVDINLALLSKTRLGQA